MKLVEAVEPGQAVQVSQAFGHFRLRKLNAPHVWVAGGIGITPFLAWAQALPETHAPVHLFACCKSREDLAHLQELRAVAKYNPNFHLHICASQAGERFCMEMLQDVLTEPAKTVVSFCGPEPMREELRTQLRKLGVKNRNFQYEEFRIRSGLPLGPVITLLRRLWSSRAMDKAMSALRSKIQPHGRGPRQRSSA